MEQIKILFCFLGVLFLGFNAHSQNDIYAVSEYPFIRNDLSRFIFPQDSSGYDSLFLKLNRLVKKGEGKINIVHIGDSHIQADYFSGRMREKLQSLYPGTLGARGFLFPSKLINSNNPFNFSLSYTGIWTGCKNVEFNKSCVLGLAGVTAYTVDTTASFLLRLRNKDCPKFDFNRIKVFHKMDASSYDVFLKNISVKEKFMENDSTGFTQFLLQNYSDSLLLYVVKKDSSQKSFTFYGLSLENDDPGITYHSIGVNGAEVFSYLKCALLPYQLSTLKPDWVIVSLGTNDCYSAKWDTINFEKNLKLLIERIRLAKPGLPILFTTPTDNFRRRRFRNPDVVIAARIILKVASENNCAVWNLFAVMGGFGSVVNWSLAGLTANDKLHFSKAGYYLQGDLLFSAFLKAYDRFIEQTIEINGLDQ